MKQMKIITPDTEGETGLDIETRAYVKHDEIDALIKALKEVIE